jgi:hypothetical protein
LIGEFPLSHEALTHFTGKGSAHSYTRKGKIDTARLILQHAIGSIRWCFLDMRKMTTNKKKKWNDPNVNGK